MPDSSPDTAEVVDTTTPAETQVSDATTDSSTELTKPAETMLDAVKTALARTEAAPASDTTDDAADAEVPDPTAPAIDPDALTPEDIKGLSAKTQKRFHSLTGELKAKDATIEGLKSKADQFDQIDTYIKNAGLSNRDVGGTLEIAAMLKHQPGEALKRLEPIVEQLRAIVGETLPAPLQQRVEQGYLTEEDAKALSRSEAARKQAEDRVTASTMQQQNERAVAEQQTQTKTTLDAVQVWEDSKAKLDPDFTLKRKEVAKEVELAILQESNRLQKPWFPDPTRAVALAEAALKEVNDRYKRYAPKPKPIDPPVTGSASSRSTPEPKNMADLIRSTIGR